MASDYSDLLMEIADDLTAPHGNSLPVVETGGRLPPNLPSTGKKEPYG